MTYIDLALALNHSLTLHILIASPVRGRGLGVGGSGRDNTLEYYVLHAMSYVLCATCYELCAVCYVQCAMGYVLWARCYGLGAMC